MTPTEEQARMLAAIEQQHGRVARLDDECELAGYVLSKCVTDTRAYRCSDCQLVFAIEPDGVTDIFSFVD